MSMSKIRRPLLASLFVLGLGITVASAYDYCAPACLPVRTVQSYCEPAPAPIRLQPANSCAPIPMPAPTPIVRSACVDPCGVPAPMPAPTPIMQPANACAPAACPSPSFSSYGMYGSTSGMYNPAGGSGISYLIPTVNGLIESPTIPITNEVDMYYATHQVVNGHVEQVPMLAANF